MQLSRRRPTRGWLAGVSLAVMFVALRVPSFLEPTWYSDEGTYADIGRSLLHGAVLYRDVWDNKPPGMYWLAAGVVSVLGPRAPAFPLVLAAVLAAGTAAVWRLGRRAGGLGVAVLATGLLVVLTSLPNFEGNLLNAEVVGGALVLWALVLLTDPLLSEAHGRPWREVAAGGLLGAACLFKAVFVLDVLVGLAVPLWAARGRAGPIPWRRVAAVAAGVGATVALATMVLARQGSLGGFVDVLFHQDVDYLQLTNGPGGAVLHGRGDGLVFTGLLVGRVAVPVAVAGLLAWRWSGRGRVWAAVVTWWLGCDVAGAMVSSRGFSHYAQQADGALVLAVALLAAAAWRRRRLGRIGAALVALATFPVVELALTLPSAEVALAAQRPFPKLENGSFRVSQIGQYYSLSWDRLTGRVSQARYEALFPTDMNRQRAVVDVLRRYSRPGDRVFVWGTVHWSYALSGRLPAGRYVSLNTAYAVDAGAEHRLVTELSADPPAVLIGDAPLPPAVVGLVGRLGYIRLAGAAGGDDVWVAPWANRSTGGT